MRERFLKSTTAVALAAAVVGAIIAVSVTPMAAQAPAPSVPVLKTPWGEPDLQGIWTDETDTPFQRSPKYANQEFFTEAQRAEFDRVRSALRGRDDRGEVGSERDVAGAYNAVWGGRKRTGTRTSMIVDPPDGRIPPVTPQSEKIAAADRDFRLDLMRATQTCKLKAPGCAGGKYDPTPTSHGADQPALYNTARMNR